MLGLLAGVVLLPIVALGLVLALFVAAAVLLLPLLPLLLILLIALAVWVVVAALAHPLARGLAPFLTCIATASSKRAAISGPTAQPKCLNSSEKRG